MKLLGKFWDGNLRELENTDDLAILAPMVESLAHYFDDPQIEEIIACHLETGFVELSIVVEDLIIDGDEIILEIPHPERVRRGERVAEAIEYVGKAKKFGLSNDEIIDDIVGQGWTNRSDADYLAHQF